ncbi:uncharacterized protein LOC121422630 [Lytechinus variegatus]|uniref:uncharacterized protein LOC121422630 n=1 Tax=Lytechinus variegatus TaxID=7654 RepID=UPI001BB0DB36|nr:uncharacterized protein LOC121422630 [Lytechinus variegatus]
MALAALFHPSDGTPGSCGDITGVGQTIPIYKPCGHRSDLNGDMVQSVAVIVQVSSFIDMSCGRHYKYGITSNHRICRIPEEGNNTVGEPMGTIEASTSSTQKASMTMNPTTSPSTTPTSTLGTTEMTSIPRTSTPEATTELTRQSTSAPFTTQPKGRGSSPVMDEFSTTVSEEPADRSSTSSPDDETTPSIPHTSVYKVPESTVHSSTSVTTTQTTPRHVTTTNATSKHDTITQETTTQLPKVQETETQGTSTQGPVMQETTTQATTTQPVTTQEAITRATTTLGTTTQATTTQSPTTQETTTQTLATLGRPTTTQSTTTQATTTQTPTTTHSATTNATTAKPAPTIRTTQQDTTVAPGISKVFVTDHQNNRIIWADLHGPERMEFSVFQSLPYKPMDIAFDHVEQMVYWSSKEEKRIWRIDVIGVLEKEAVINENFQDEPLGIAIAEHSRHLYCTYESVGWISRVEIGNPDSETLFAEGLFKPKAIAIDERNGYLYWSRHEGIDRKRLNSTTLSGDGVEEVIDLPVFSEMNGLIINRNGTRLFFCDENSKRALYLDITRDDTTATTGGNAIDIIDEGFLLRDVGMGSDGALYWLQPGEKRIVVMDDYRLSSEFHFEAQQEFGDPQRMHIARVIV